MGLEQSILKADQKSASRKNSNLILSLEMSISLTATSYGSILTFIIAIWHEWAAKSEAFAFCFFLRFSQFL